MEFKDNIIFINVRTYKIIPPKKLKFSFKPGESCNFGLTKYVESFLSQSFATFFPQTLSCKTLIEEHRLIIVFVQYVNAFL